MEINVHDIIKIDSVKELLFYVEKPSWVNDSIKEYPYVIVRRAQIENNLIPVGIRGDEKHERISGFILKSAIKELYTPEMVTKRYNKINKHILIKETMQKLDLIMKKANVRWGIFGSIAYEIITGKPTINENSDIDVIIRDRVPKESLTKLVNQLEEIPIQVDVLIETSIGGYNFKEYLSKESSKLLIKTNYGPHLVLKNNLAFK